jgi:hypothetical protein
MKVRTFKYKTVLSVTQLSYALGVGVARCDLAKHMLTAGLLPLHDPSIPLLPRLGARDAEGRKPGDPLWAPR